MRERPISLAIRYDSLLSALTLSQERARELTAAPLISSDPQRLTDLEQWNQEIDSLCSGFRRWGRDIKSSGISHDDSSSEVLRVFEASELQNTTLSASLIDEIPEDNAFSKLASLDKDDIREATTANEEPSTAELPPRSPERGKRCQHSEQGHTHYMTGSSEAPRSLEEAGIKSKDGEEKAVQQNEVPEKGQGQQWKAASAGSRASTSNTDDDLRTSSQILHEIFDQVDRRLGQLQVWIDAHAADASQKQSSTNETFEFDSLPPILGHLQKCLLELKIRIDSIHEQYERKKDHVAGLQQHPVSLLTLDGGGVRGYSSLLILQKIMQELQELSTVKENSVRRTDALPRDYFDYIFGSSTGGLSAIMLGRLKMELETALRTYKECCDTIFSHPRRLHVKSRFPLFRIPRPKYDQVVLNRIVKEVMSKNLTSAGSNLELLSFAAPEDRCRTAVIAVEQEDGKPRIFRSYLLETDNSLNQHEASVLPYFPPDTYPIWKVARATSAAPAYFPAVKLSQETYVDGGFGFNNPSYLAYREVEKRHESIGMILSIGSGTFRDGSTPKSLNPLDRIVSSVAIIRTLQSLVNSSTETERNHQIMSDIAKARRVSYFRFSVDSSEFTKIKLDEWHKDKAEDGSPRYTILDRIQELTEKYLDRPEIRKMIRQCAHQLLAGRRSVL